MPVDVFRDKDGALIVKANLPGVAKEDVKVTFDDNHLDISGEFRKETDAKDDGWHRQERVVGSFSRAFTLPDDVNPDEATATCKDGVLQVRLPSRPNAKPKSREVKVS